MKMCRMNMIAAPLLALTVALTVVLGPQALADPASERAAEKLLDEMDMDVAFERSIDQMLDMQIQRNPALVPYRHVMQTFFRKYMRYQDLKPQMVKMYADAFTESELREITAFYATSTGKKTIRIMPELMSRGAEIGSRRVQENIGELQEMIRAESERLQRRAAQGGDKAN